jgi:hypothetical protein
MPNPTHKEIRTMSKEKLIEHIDECLKDINPARGNSTLDMNLLLLIQIYRDELVRREQDKATRQMLYLTWAITFLTFVMLSGLVIQIYLAIK